MAFVWVPCITPAYTWVPWLQPTLPYQGESVLELYDSPIAVGTRPIVTISARKTDAWTIQILSAVNSPSRSDTPIATASRPEVVVWTRPMSRLGFLSHSQLPRTLVPSKAAPIVLNHAVFTASAWSISQNRSGARIRTSP